MMKLVEECDGVGQLLQGGTEVRRVRYRISRYQGMMPSGMPIPGLHRVEGSVEVEASGGVGGLVGAPLTLRLDDGRTMPITIEDETGRVLTEGHGPRLGCSCC
jgi:hypothetical protein